MLVEVSVPILSWLMALGRIPVLVGVGVLGKMPVVIGHLPDGFSVVVSDLSHQLLVVPSSLLYFFLMSFRVLHAILSGSLLKLRFHFYC